MAELVWEHQPGLYAELFCGHEARLVPQWFDHFSLEGVSAFKFGAKALALYALSHRDTVSASFFGSAVCDHHAPSLDTVTVRQTGSHSPQQPLQCAAAQTHMIRLQTAAAHCSRIMPSPA